MLNVSMPPRFAWSLPFKGYPSRIFLAFALGIVLPSGFLSYMGFRSFHTEQKWLRSQTEERNREAAGTLRRRAEEILGLPFQELSALGQSDTFKVQDLPKISKSLFALRALGGAPLHFCILLDAKGREIFPSPAAAAAPLEEEPWWGDLSSDVHQANRFEFQEKRYPEALQLYRSLSARARSPAQGVYLLKCQASLNRKMGNNGAAEELYQRLINENDSTPDPSGDPTGLVARQLLARLYDASKESEKAFALRLGTLEGILLQRWPRLPRRAALLGDLASRIDQEAPEIADGPLKARAALLKKSYQRFLEQTPMAENFLRNKWPALLGRMRQQGWSDHGGLFRDSINHDDETWTLVVPVGGVGTGDSRGTLIAVVSAGKLWPPAQRILQEFAGAKGLYATLVHDAVSPHHPLAIERRLSYIDPEVLLRIGEQTADPADRESRRRLWTYGGMIGLSLLVLSIGLFLMDYATRREREMAAWKSDFVAGVSHELRTPLASIRYIGERLTRGRYRSTEEVQELYGMLHEESERLDELIKDVLDFSKMSRGKKEFQSLKFDLRDALSEAVERLRGKAQAGGFAIEAEKPLPEAVVSADQNAVVLAIANLLDNAMKYSGASRRVFLALRLEKKRAGVEVADEGVGIAPEEQSAIFEKFYRSSRASSKNVSGAGLGLAMVKHIVEAHGGKITLTSEQGKGSVFTLWLPLFFEEGKTE
jgi:signal transduction histidine kinase